MRQGLSFLLGSSNGGQCRQESALAPDRQPVQQPPTKRLETIKTHTTRAFTSFMRMVMYGASCICNGLERLCVPLAIRLSLTEKQHAGVRETKAFESRSASY